MNLDRRSFIRFVVSGSMVGGAILRAETKPEKSSVTGEAFDVCHRLRDGGDFPPTSMRSTHEVVIVGGGISGLTAAYMLPDRDVLILEKEPAWGGNAQHAEYDGQPYAIGAAFIGLTDAAGRFAKELGLQPQPIDNWDGTIANGRFVPDTWGKGLESLPYPRSVRQRFAALRRDVLARYPKDDDLLDDVPFSRVLEPYGPQVLEWWGYFLPVQLGFAQQSDSRVVGGRRIALDGRARSARYPRHVAWRAGSNVSATGGSPVGPSELLHDRGQHRGVRRSSSRSRQRYLCAGGCRDNGHGLRCDYGYAAIRFATYRG